jgi:hypothetical protein
MDEETTQRRSLTGPIVGAIIIVLVVVWGAWMQHVGPFTVNTWSAVFLSDSEVFFGHVQNVSSDTINMTNVFYLTKTSSGATSTQAQGQAQQLSLTGLVANQIQCPTDQININRSVVLYIQDLQAGSYVVQQLARLTATAQTCFTPPAATATPAASASASATAH